MGCEVHLQTSQVCGLQVRQSFVHVGVPCSVAWMEVWILCHFHYGIPHHEDGMGGQFVHSFILAVIRIYNSWVELLPNETLMSRLFLCAQVLSLVSELRQAYRMVDDLLKKPSIYWSIRTIFRIYVLVVFGYCLLPFVLLTFPKWSRALSQLHFFAHLIYLPWILIGPVLIPLLRPKKVHLLLKSPQKTQ